MSSDEDRNSRKIFECNKCGRTFSTQFSMTRHIRIVHENLREFECECGKTFATKEQKERHFITKHTSERPFACEMGCSKRFSSTNARKYHYKSKHDFNNMKYSTLSHAEESTSHVRQNPINSLAEIVKQEAERLKDSIKNSNDSSSLSVHESDIEDFIAFLNHD